MKAKLYGATEDSYTPLPTVTNFTARPASFDFTAFRSPVPAPVPQAGQATLSEVEGRRIQSFACFDFALRATLSMSGLGLCCANVLLFNLAKKASVILVSLAVWLAMDLGPLWAAAPEDAPLAIVEGMLIDGNGGPPVHDAVVLIQGEKIVAAGPRGTVQIPDNACPKPNTIAPTGSRAPLTHCERRGIKHALRHSHPYFFSKRFALGARARQDSSRLVL
jgi:hypothetical protein